MSNRIAVIAAHPDDEVLGCGGTLARLAEEGNIISILLIADGESSRGFKSKSFNKDQISTRIAAAETACSILGCNSIEALNLPDNRLDSLNRLDIIQPIEEFIECHQPAMVFTHHSGDVNIDHRIVHDAVVTTCRPQPDNPVKELLFFEIPSSTEWRPSGSNRGFNPNVFINITTTLPIKREALLAYKNELRAFPHPRSLKAIEALAEWRGATVCVEAAEAFILGRQII